MADEIYSYLSEVKPFSFLPGPELKNISGKIKKKKYKKDTIISVQGKTKLDKILVIIDGQLELFSEKMGKRLLSGYMGRGEICNGIAILMNLGIAVRTLSVNEDTTCYEIPEDIFKELCVKYNFFHEFFTSLYKRIVVDESASKELTRDSANEFLVKVAPFSFLPEGKLLEISSLISIGRFSRGKIVFTQGRDKIEYLLILKRGSAEKYSEEKDEKKLKDILTEGAIYGGISILINDSVPIRTLKLLEKSYFYLLPKDIFIALCEEFSEFAEFFTNTFGKLMLDKSYASMLGKAAQSEDSSIRFFNQPISTIYNNNQLFCTSNTTIQEASLMMIQHRLSSIIVNDNDGKALGIVTDYDLKEKVISKNIAATNDITKIMSSPLITLSTKDEIFDGLIIMMHKHIRHLVITDPEGNAVGVITNNELLAAQGQSPIFFLREISSTMSESEILDKHEKLSPIIKNLIQSGAKAENVNKIVTSVSDSILEKIISFVLNESEPPPCKFAFMIMGSEGRGEQTLKTDQDNAIIYEDVTPEKEKEVKDYFNSFGEKVCNLLNEANFEFCKGNIMAKNPEFCASKKDWERKYTNWIYDSNQEDLLQISIFFDFKCAYGEECLIKDLKDFLFKSLENERAFFVNLARNAINFKPPIGFFRNFLVESKGSNRDSFDIKKAMVPIVDFSRLFALKNEIRSNNTFVRLNKLREKEIISEERHIEIKQSYSYLMQFRFLTQIAAIDEGKGPDNYINPKKLSHIEQTMLKEIFKTTERLQSKIKYEFLGSI